ncbi:1-phosphofructokinase [Haloarchaeobius sp. HME9146]|uniref:1-phosphofructokinase n=1 Tax=Haloarchaeobius sp. HME9146 TaxID=2978732 RepID=UPI0021C1578C|nr:1-phosphofructokinase [Haloarchaeobius sp. HME9146]MCT9097060.1 1-phosphofructokinase family hexose kinase [Haloarchaeobius sp. HME9146]
MILTVTLNPAVDHTVTVDEAFTPDTVHRAGSARYDAGGKGINVSKYLVELGRETVATGVLGGFLGEFVRERLAADGIPQDFVDIDGLTRLNTTVLGEEEYKVNQNGPTVGVEAIDAVIETIEHHEPELVVVAGSLPPGLTTDAIDAISRAGDWQTVVDVGGATLQSLDANYALCKPNRAELAAATEMPVGTVDECAAAAEAFREEGFETVVASLGSDGAVLASSDGTYHAPALDVDVVDTVGAGDALLSGVLAALDRGVSPRQALGEGVAVASKVVAVAGTSIPSLADLPTDAEHVSVTVH